MSEIRQCLVFSVRRMNLIAGLVTVTTQLFDAGVDEIVIAGSFCTSAAFPNDIDGYWVFKPGLNLSGVDADILRMNAVALDPRTGLMSRVVKIKYGVELFMHNPSIPTRLDGVAIPDFFSRSRDGVARGCVRILKEHK